MFGELKKYAELLLRVANLENEHAWRVEVLESERAHLEKLQFELSMLDLELPEKLLQPFRDCGNDCGQIRALISLLAAILE